MEKATIIYKETPHVTIDTVSVTSHAEEEVGSACRPTNEYSMEDKR